MKKAGLLIGLLLATVFGFAQTFTTKDNASEKIQKLYQKARHYSAGEQYKDALEELKKIFKEDSTFIDGYLLWGDIQFDSQKYEDAAQAYKKVLQIYPDYNLTVNYRLAMSFFNQEKYEESIPFFESFLKSGNKNADLQRKATQRIGNARFAATAIKNPVPFQPAKLSANINTPYPEYLPSLTVDGQFLVYTAIIKGQEDFYYSEKINGEWQLGKPIENINTTDNEGAQNISADGKLLVFTACGRQDGVGSCDIYFSVSRNGKWTKPRNLGVPVNSKDWESQPSLSADGNELYFASKRAGTLGGSDLWMSRRQSNGTWGNPQNLGKQVNTPEDDQAPFLHPDGQTLYFMSQGHPGMGGFDLYFSKRNADGSWGVPKNLGYPINTKANEGALVVNLDGTTAYFATDEPDKTNAQMLARKNLDIYSFTLYPEARPNPVTYVKAKVIDANTKLPLVAKVEITDLKTDQVYTSSQTDVEGTFLVCLPQGKDYALNVAKEQYLFHSENFDLSEQNSIKEPFLLEIELVPITEVVADGSPGKAKPVVLKNVFFETASASLRSESKAELNRLKRLLDENPKLKIRINGHTDNVGADKDNLTLSEKRAKSVYDFLAQQGIVAARLSYKGFGESQPISTNDTPQGRQVNRRTEFEAVN